MHRAPVALRAADAVQLASALMLREKLRTSVAFLAFDERLATAAETEGLPRPPQPGREGPAVGELT